MSLIFLLPQINLSLNLMIHFMISQAMLSDKTSPCCNCSAYGDNWKNSMCGLAETYQYVRLGSECWRPHLLLERAPPACVLTPPLPTPDWAFWHLCVHTAQGTSTPPPGAGAGLPPVPAPHVPTAHNLAVTLRETPVPRGWHQSVGLS